MDIEKDKEKDKEELIRLASQLFTRMDLFNQQIGPLESDIPCTHSSIILDNENNTIMFLKFLQDELTVKVMSVPVEQEPRPCDSDEEYINIKVNYRNVISVNGLAYNGFKIEK